MVKKYGRRDTGRSAWEEGGATYSLVAAGAVSPMLLLAWIIIWIVLSNPAYSAAVSTKSGQGA